MNAERRTILLELRNVFWFSAGIVIAMVLATVVVGLRAAAAPDPDEATFVPMVPCRLMDTRPEPDTVGPRSTPLGVAETHVQQVTGSNGDCTVPADASGVALNVTTVAPTAPSFLTVFPSDAPLPEVSNINYLPGSAPAPNKVDVKLSASGEISFYNLAGSVHVIADVSGYYSSGSLQGIQADIDHLRGLVGRNWTLTAVVADDGTTPFSVGPFTAKRIATGIYNVRFEEVAGFRIPRTTGLSFVSPVPVASTDCDGYPASTDLTGYGLKDGYYDLIDISVRVTNSAGAFADCDFTLHVNVEDPDPSGFVTP